MECYQLLREEGRGEKRSRFVVDPREEVNAPLLCAIIIPASKYTERNAVPSHSIR